MQEPNPVTNNISAAAKPMNPSRPSHHQIEPHKPSMMLIEIFGEVSRFDFEPVGFDDEDNEISGFDEVGLGEAESSCKKLLYTPIWSSGNNTVINNKGVLWSYGGKRGTKRNCPTLACVQEYLMAEGDVIISLEDLIWNAEQRDNDGQNNQLQNPTKIVHSPELLLLDSDNRSRYHDIAVKLQSAAVKGNKKEVGEFLRNDPSMIRWAITRGHETLLHVATGAKQTALVKMIMGHIETNDLMLQDRNGNTAFCFAAAVGATKIAEMMLDRNRRLATFRGSQNKTPLYMAVLFGQKKMAEKLYTTTLPLLKPREQIAIFFKSIDNGLYDIALKLLESNPNLAVERYGKKTALHVLARQPSAFAGKSVLNSIINNKGVLWSYGGKRGTKRNCPTLACVQEYLMAEGDVHLSLEVRILAAQRRDNDVQNNQQQNPTKIDHPPVLVLLDRSNRREYHEIAVKLQSAAVKGDKKKVGEFLKDGDPSKIRWAITRGHETLLHVATGAKQTALVKMIMGHMQPNDLMLQDRNGNTAFCFAAAVGDTKIAEMMLDRNRLLATFRGSQNKTPLYMAVLFRQKKMAEKLYTTTLPHLTPLDQIAIFFKSIDTGLYDIALKLLENNPNLAVVRFGEKTALHVLARQPSAFAGKSVLNSS
ncbi:hypothetical protein EZV62_000477 [Acer yangbiense]|uniref:Uncharacterized protein n=1 Tax=Acer yangbiense TaxID=1000413 RepID=A0A5C7IRZ1_9ROSI|nr:hypothetical protein EZV62_000477 [Acer yangbiense]